MSKEYNLIMILDNRKILPFEGKKEEIERMAGYHGDLLVIIKRDSVDPEVIDILRTYECISTTTTEFIYV